MHAFVGPRVQPAVGASSPTGGGQILIAAPPFRAGNRPGSANLRYGWLVTRIGYAFLTLTFVVACQQDNQAVVKKLDDISRRLAVIEAKLGNAPGAGAGAAGAQAPRPTRRQPDPSAIYAVPVGESASIGSKLAKVTIVEAFTFT
jgi:hypothetical protein